MNTHSDDNSLNLNTSACDFAPGFEGLDRTMLWFTFYVSLLVVLPIFYEIGKAVAPGNRAMKPPDVLRVEPYSLGRWEFTRKIKQQCAYLCQSAAWTLSFISPDLYIAALAEVWLGVIHSAVPPSAFTAPTSAPPSASSVASKRASLGWSALMRSSETRAISVHETSNERRFIGLFGADSVFKRTFDVQARALLRSQAQEHDTAIGGEMPETGDKAVYEGERNELGVWHGFGKLRTKAYTYEGSFKDGQASGFGRCDYTDGEIYIGENQESQKHGIGLLNINGDIFQGLFKNGKRHGPFSVIMNGYLAHPTYRDRIHVGHNASLDDSYRGERNEKCQRHGKGAAIFKSGDMYVGEFSEDKMHGSGALFFHTLKGVYMGEMQDNLMHGKGKFISPEGVVRIGTWEHGLKRMTRRFALEPATSAEEENARWDEFKSERELPTYSEFISYQYQSVLSVFYRRICCVPGCLQTRLFAKFWAAVWVWYGFGNFSA